jgi:hypothetical protein
LQQRDDAGDERVIAYASRSNNRAEVIYGSYAGECLAAVWAVRYFRVYLYGAHFILYTDHRPLEWLMTSQTLTRMHTRWALILSEFDFEVKYRKGLVNMNADGLSRSPLPETEDNTGGRMHEDLPGGLIEGSPSAASPLLAWSAWAVEEPEGVEIPTVEDPGRALGPTGSAGCEAARRYGLWDPGCRGSCAGRAGTRGGKSQGANRRVGGREVPAIFAWRAPGESGDEEGEGTGAPAVPGIPVCGRGVTAQAGNGRGR